MEGLVNGLASLVIGTDSFANQFDFNVPSEALLIYCQDFECDSKQADFFKQLERVYTRFGSEDCVLLPKLSVDHARKVMCLRVYRIIKSRI
jgi:hypothetical protein